MTFYQRQRLSRLRQAPAITAGCPSSSFWSWIRDIAERIVAGQNARPQIKDARSKGYGDLLESGVRAVFQGQTTAEEVISVASMGDGIRRMYDGV